VLPDMHDNYELPADHRPWQARRPDWAVSSPRQDHPAPFGQPEAPSADVQAWPPSWAGRRLSPDPAPSLEPSSAAGLTSAGRPARGPYPGHVPGGSASLGLGPADWAAQDPGSTRPAGDGKRGGLLERRPADWLVYDPGRSQPAVPSQPPYPARPAPSWRQAWADYDPYSGYPMWPGHPGYAARNAGLRRLSKLTWRAAEVSAVIAVGFAALFARTAHSAASHAAALHSAKPSIHAAATHHAHKRHKPKRHHHHYASAAAPGLAPPAAPPAAPAAAPPPPPPPAAPAPPPPPAAPPPPPPPPPPVTTSGGSGGG